MTKGFKSSVVQGTANPSWVSKERPQGECFDLGMFMKKYPHFVLLEVYNQAAKGLFGQKTVAQDQLIGYCEVNTEDLIAVDNYGQEIYMFLEDAVNRNSLIKLRSLFVPSVGTLERLNLDLKKSVFKNAQQFLFYKVLLQGHHYDDYGFRVPTGKYLLDYFLSESTTSPLQASDDISNRYERFSPEHRRHLKLRESQPLRPKLEENIYMFKQLWLYSQFRGKNQALTGRQRMFWEEFMGALMA